MLWVGVLMSCGQWMGLLLLLLLMLLRETLPIVLPPLLLLPPLPPLLPLLGTLLVVQQWHCTCLQAPVCELAAPLIEPRAPPLLPPPH